MILWITFDKATALLIFYGEKGVGELTAGRHAMPTVFGFRKDGVARWGPDGGVGRGVWGQTGAHG